MDQLLEVSLLSPEKPLAQLKVRKLEVNGREGQMGILPGHTALLAELKPGVLKIEAAENGNHFYYFVSQGYIKLSQNRATVMAEVIESPEEVDHARVEEAEKRALERLARTTDQDIDIARAQQALARARARKALLSLRSKQLH